LEALGGKYPEIKQVASRCAIALRSCLKQCNGERWLFEKLIRLRISHYCGNHNQCSEWRNRPCDTSLNLTSAEAKEKFTVCHSCTAFTLLTKL